MRVTDQPGRWLAIFVVAPFLMHVAICLEKHKETKLAKAVGALALTFFVYEIYWVTFYPPKEVYVSAFSK